MFRFLLEAHDNLALFTVLKRDTALLKIIFAPQSRCEVLRVLHSMGDTISLSIQEWPASPSQHQPNLS